MNIRTRDFSFLGYTLALSHYMSLNFDEKVQWRAKKINEAAKDIVSQYPGGKLKQKTIRHIEKKTSDIIKKCPYSGYAETEEEQDNMVVNFSFILCVLDDIFKNSNNKEMVEKFDILCKRIVWIISLFDSKLNKEHCYTKGDSIYTEWVKEY